MSGPGVAESALDDIERAVTRDRSHVVVATAPGPCTDMMLGAVADRLRASHVVVRLGAATGEPEELWSILLDRLGRTGQVAGEAAVTRALRDHQANDRPVAVLLRNADSASKRALEGLGRVAAESGMLLVLACEVQDAAPVDPVPGLVQTLGLGVQKVCLESPGQRAAIEQRLVECRSLRSRVVPPRQVRHPHDRTGNPRRSAHKGKPKRKKWLPVLAGAAVASLAVAWLEPEAVTSQAALRFAGVSAPSPPAVSAQAPQRIPSDLIARQLAGAVRENARRTVQAQYATVRGVAKTSQAVAAARAAARSGSVSVAKASAPAASAPLRPAAAPEPARVPLSINAVPWARIEIDGVEVGVTPIGELPTRPGRHRVRAHLPDGRVIDRDVTLGQGGGHVAFDDTPY